MTCPDETTLLALVEGRVTGDALATVDAHLDACPECQDTVAALSSRRAESGPRPARADAPDAPATVGRYVIESLLGEGAMGVLYAAFDPELGRRVALKLLRRDRDDPKNQVRLAREAQAMARLSHPNVVSVYDVGLDSDRVYIAMELVDGQNMRDWLAAAKRAPAEVLDVLRQAGAGLRAAHEAGLVHRDFKPDNVLVDVCGVAKVGDFGLAWAEPQASVTPSAAPWSEGALTRTGAHVGTPAYMAPEQLRGETAGAACDQFAFAVTAWEALTGERPFRGNSPAALLAAIEAGPGPAPHPALPRALRAGPAHRYPSLTLLLTALAPRPPRWRAPAAVLAMLLVAAGTLAVALAWPSPGDPCAASRTAIASSWNDETRARADGALPAGALRRRAETWARAWTAARVDACEATHVRNEQTDARLEVRIDCLDRQRGTFDALLARLDGLSEPPAHVVDALDALGDPSACDGLAVGAAIGAEGSADQTADGAKRRELDALRLQVALGEGVELHAVEVFVEAPEVVASPRLHAEALLLYAEVALGRARYREAEEAARRALLVAERVGADGLAAESWLVLLQVRGERGEYRRAAEASEHAAAALQRIGDPPGPTATLHRRRAVVRMNLGDFDGARDDLDAAERSITRRHGAGDPQLAGIETSRGNLMRLAGDFDAALSHHRSALAIDRAALGRAHPRVGEDLHNVAGVLRRMGRADEAAARYAEALAIKRAALGDHPETALTHNSLGLLALDRGDEERARRELDEALRVLEAHDHAEAALVRYNRALLALRQERFADARDDLQRAIARDEQRLGPDAKRVAVELIALGRAWQGLGDARRAGEAFERADQIGDAIGDVELAAEIAAARAAPPLETVAPAVAATVRRPSVRAPAITDRPSAAAPPTDPPRSFGSTVYAPGQAWD